MDINEYIYKNIKNTKDISCQAFLIDGKCPKSRYLKDCPLIDARYCVTEKE